MDAPLYCLEGVRKSYDGQAVVNLECLEVGAGEVLTLVGPSGAGKSTLLRLLNFLEPPTAGTVAYRGRCFRDQHVPLAVRREITTVFQRPALLRGSVRRNVAYGLRLRGRRDDRRVEQILAQLGLGDLASARAQRLSGGQMQRVALARALVVRPTVLLLDEPTANLDPYNVALIEDIVRRQNREEGTTVVLVTHNVFQARRLATRVGLMLAGRLIEIGSAPQFFDSPADPRTAAFVRGEMVY
ncbi:MAG: ATP-binding cassette domain-containing protein [Candidatus Anammoximicrobium sp.]|nr:ATP-binding cassette domain-containing protein [Candidatus Anammoximicrobium sp.]